MSRYDYIMSRQFPDVPFYALIMAAMDKADDKNQILLRQGFPQVWEELQMRYNLPGGELPEDKITTKEDHDDG